MNPFRTRSSERVGKDTTAYKRSVSANRPSTAYTGTMPMSRHRPECTGSHRRVQGESNEPFLNGLVGLAGKVIWLGFLDRRQRLTRLDRLGQRGCFFYGLWRSGWRRSRRQRSRRRSGRGSSARRAFLGSVLASRGGPRRQLALPLHDGWGGCNFAQETQGRRSFIYATWKEQANSNEGGAGRINPYMGVVGRGELPRRRCWGGWGYLASPWYSRGCFLVHSVHNWRGQGRGHCTAKAGKQRGWCTPGRSSETRGRRDGK